MTALVRAPSSPARSTRIQEYHGLLPGNVADAILSGVSPYFSFSDPGSLEVESKYEIMDLQKLVGDLDTCFNDTPASSVNTDGLFNVISDYMASAELKQSLEVTLKTTRSLASAGASADLKEIGGKANLEIAEHRSKTIYEYPEGGSDED